MRPVDFTPEEAAGWLAAEKERRGLTYEAPPSREWRTLPLCSEEGCDLPAEFNGRRCWRCGLKAEREGRRKQKQRWYQNRLRKEMGLAPR